MSKHMLVVEGDYHGGSNIAICNPEGIELDDGGNYVPSRAQRWLWDQRDVILQDVVALRDHEAPDSIGYAINGDCVDGNHHGTSQIVSPLESMHVRIAHRVIVRGLELIEPEYIHMTRGTGSHVGKAGGLEEGLARVLRAEGYPMIEDPDTGQVTSYHRRYELGGLLIDQRHHGRMGQRAHTRGPYTRWYAQDIEWEHRLDEDRPPDIALRAHNHIYDDSGRAHRQITRVVAGPCWQLSTEYSHRRSYEALPSIGLYVVIIRDGRDDVIPFLAKPDRPTIIREAA